MMRLLEGKNDLSVYRKLIRTMYDYKDKLPATGVGQWYENAILNGIKIMPKDAAALSVLDFILSDNESVPAKMQKLMNITFAELPIEMRPQYKLEKNLLVPFWGKDDGKLYDRVISLLSFDGKSKGNWVDNEGKKVSIIDFKESK